MLQVFLKYILRCEASGAEGCVYRIRREENGRGRVRIRE